MKENEMELLDDCDVRKILRVSRRTLYNYRVAGLKHFKINKKCWYLYTDIIDFLARGGQPNV